MNKPLKNRIFVAILIFLIFIIFIEIYRGVKVQSFFELSKIPRFNAIDIRGRQINNRDLMGQVSFFHFVNPYNPEDHELINQVVQNWQHEAINILVFSNMANIKLDIIESASDNLFVIHEQFDKFTKLFSVHEGEGVYCITDRRGRIVISSNSDNAYQKDVKVRLLELLKQKKFLTSDFISLNHNIHNVEWLSIVSELIDSENKDYYVISLFTNICDTCSGGSTIKTFQNIHNKHQDTVRVASILLDSYTQNDIRRLKSHLNINFMVMRANIPLSNKWRHYINEFRESDLTNIAFVVDKTGQVLEMADRNCNCWAQFFDNLYSRLRKNTKDVL
jgi:hypothetical protein